MDELLAQFLIEGPELVEEGAEVLAALELRPDDRRLIDEAFRAVHTLKGSAGLFDLPPMSATLHAAEDVLSALRDDGRAIDRTVIGLLLTVLDQTQAWLTALEALGALPGDAADRARRLVEELTTIAEVAPGAAAGNAGPAPDWALALAASLPAEARAAPLIAIRYEPDPGCYFRGDDPLAIVARTPGLVHLALSLRADPEPEGPYDPFTCNLVIEAAASAALEPVREVFRFVPDQVSFVELRPQAADAADARSPEVLGRTLRIDAGRIEALARVVDELIAAKTGLASVVAMARDRTEASELSKNLAAQYALLDRLVGQAHQGVMGLRVAPVQPLLRRFTRVVRDMAAAVGKDVDLVLEGDGVEADRAIVEGLLEPLTHLLRNAVDHGVETPEGRLRAGKPARAVVTLSARERAGRMNITVSDDGRGVAPDTIRSAAARRGLVETDRLESMTDAEIIDLIFMPGFSTAEAVSALSGRGVGMDAIRAALQRLGGRIALTSERGVGTSVELSLPLTVSLTQVMVVSHLKERYGVPVNGVLETLRLRADQVIPIRAGHAFNWRDRAVPLLPLSQLTGGDAALPAGDQRVLVVHTGRQPVGLAIDAIEDRLDVAVRPLDGLLSSMRGLAGTTVLGDGQVLMILDPEALIG